MKPLSENSSFFTLHDLALPTLVVLCMKILSLLLALTNYAKHPPRLWGSLVTLVLKLLIEFVGFLTILIVPNLIGQPAHLEEAQLIKRFANDQTFVKRLNHLLELRHNSIKSLFLQKRLTSFS